MKNIAHSIFMMCLDVSGGIRTCLRFSKSMHETMEALLFFMTARQAIPLWNHRIALIALARALLLKNGSTFRFVRSASRKTMSVGRSCIRLGHFAIV